MCRMERLPDDVVVDGIGGCLAFQAFSLSWCSRRFQQLLGGRFALRDAKGCPWVFGVAPTDRGLLWPPQWTPRSTQGPRTLWLSAKDVSPALCAAANALVQPAPWLRVTIVRCDGDLLNAAVLLSAWNRAARGPVAVPCFLVCDDSRRFLLAVAGGSDAREVIRHCGGGFPVLPGVFALWNRMDARRGEFVKLAGNDDAISEDADPTLLLHVWTEDPTHPIDAARDFYACLMRHRRATDRAAPLYTRV